MFVPSSVKFHPDMQEDEQHRQKLYCLQMQILMTQTHKNTETTKLELKKTKQVLSIKNKHIMMQIIMVSFSFVQQSQATKATKICVDRHYHPHAGRMFGLISDGEYEFCNSVHQDFRERGGGVKQQQTQMTTLSSATFPCCFQLLSSSKLLWRHQQHRDPSMPLKRQQTQQESNVLDLKSYQNFINDSACFLFREWSCVILCLCLKEAYLILWHRKIH